MYQSLTDKLLILLLTVLPVYILSEGFTNGYYVLSLLAELGVILLSELIKMSRAAVLVSVLIISSAVLIPDIVTACPSAIYYLVQTFLSEKQDNLSVTRIFLIILKTAAVSCLIAEPFLIVTDMTVCMLISVISVMAAYIGIKTAAAKHTVHRLTSEFDDARQDFINAKRLGEEIWKNADNEVYLARLKERNRIAREIHDNVGHMITSVIVRVQALKIINKDAKVREQLDSVTETLDLAMTGIRKSVHELHDDSIDLSISINDIASVIGERFDTKVRTSIDSPADSHMKNNILGIIKEAVTNISKHSKGDKALIEVIENNTFWRISVWDNGKNPSKEYDLSPESISDGRGIGLSNIASRARSSGGRAAAVSNEEGFKVTVSLPKERRSAL